MKNPAQAPAKSTIGLQSKTLLLAALSTAMATSYPVLAQDLPVAKLEEVIVTATKRRESVQDIAATVRAFDSELLRDLDVQSVSDVVTLLPNVQIKGYPTGDVTIRGVAQSRLGQSPVAYHVNGVFKYGVDSLVGQFFDLQSVEVIQGPTGTVYGRNSTAGAINVIQQPPTAEFDAYADVNVGNFNEQEFRGVINSSLLGDGDERLMGRLVLQRQKHDGYIDNKLADDDQDYGAADNTFVRGSLRSIFGDDSQFTLRGHWNENKDNYDGATQALSEYPIGVLSGAPFDLYNGLVEFRQSDLALGLGEANRIFRPELTLPEAVDDALLNGVPELDIPRILSSNALFTPAALPVLQGTTEVRSNAFQRSDPKLTIEGFDGEFVTMLDDIAVLGDTRLNVIAGWENTKKKTNSDVDGTELPVLDVFRDEDIDLYSAELRLTSENDGPFSWIVGLFYFERDYSLDLSESITPFGVFSNVQQIEEDGIGVFFSGAYEFNEQWEVFGGIRYNEDSYKLTQDSGGGGIGDGDVTFTGDDSFSEVTGEAGLEYRFNDTDMAYIKYNHGYKAGSVEVDPAGEVNSVKPEKVDAGEAGLRTEWLDQQLRLNLTGFYYDYTDLQVPVITATIERTESAGAATIWGVEFDATYLITPDWEISGSVGYLNAEFDKFCAPDEYQIQNFGVQTDPECQVSIDGESIREGTLDLSGNKLEDAPEWKAVFLTSYIMELGNAGNLKFILQSTWTDNYYLRPFNTPVDEVGSFFKSDFRVLWNSPAETFSVEAYIENIEDDTNANRLVTLPDYAGGQPGYFGASLPRIYGIRFGYNYGGS